MLAPATAASLSMARRFVNNWTWSTSANSTLLLMLPLHWQEPRTSLPKSQGSEPGTSGNRDICIVDSAAEPGLLVSRHAAVLSVTLNIVRRRNTDSEAFFNSPFCYRLERRGFRGADLCFLVQIPRPLAAVLALLCHCHE